MAGLKIPDVHTAPPDELGHFKHHFSITMELENHPWFVAMAALALGLLLIYMFGRSRGVTQGTAVAATTSANDQSSIPQPIVIQPTPVTVGPPTTGNPPTTSPTTGGSTYTIVASDMGAKGGTLHAIATRFGVSYSALFKANSPTPLGTDINHAKFGIGTVLTIPGK